jgi:uncharacterized protein (DUF2267 family)
MDHQGVIATVQQRTQLPAEQAERAACVTLHTLAQRISVGEAEDLAQRLPEELRPCLEAGGPQEKFHLDEFLRRIEKQLEVDRPTAERVARAVFATLWSAVGEGEFNAVRSQLPGDFAPLLLAAEAEAPGPSLKDLPFVGSLSSEEYLNRVAERAGIDRDQAGRAAEAVLEALAMRVSAGQIEDLAPFLPAELRPALERGLARSRGRAMRLTLDAFLDEVKELEGVSRGDATAHARAVLAVLREAVGEKEFHDTTEQLPDEFRILLRGYPR